MAFLMCITTTGFSMNIHFCGGELQDVAFFSGDTECSMMMEMKQAPACPMHAQVTKHCCQDKDLQIEADAPETFFGKSAELHPVWNLAAPEMNPAVPSSAEKALLASFTTYRPPPLQRDIPVLVQSFLL